MMPTAQNIIPHLIREELHDECLTTMVNTSSWKTIQLKGKQCDYNIPALIDLTCNL